MARLPRQSGSPDLRGRTVRIEPADHTFAGRTGVVVAQEPCHMGCECGFDDVFVELDGGHITLVYEPEVSVVS